MISDKIYSLDLSYLQSLQISEIEQNLSKFPYASNLRVLRLLALKVQNDENFATVLHQDAALVPDRALLKKRIDFLTAKMSEHQNQTSAPTIIDENIQEEETSIEKTYESDNEHIESTDLNQQSNQQEDAVIIESDGEISQTNTVSELENVDELNLQDEIQDNIPPLNTDAMPVDKPETGNEFHDEALSEFAKWLKTKSANPAVEITQTIIDQEQTSAQPTVIETETLNVRAEEPSNEWEGIQDKILSQYQADLTEGKTKAKKKEKQSSKSKKKKENDEIDETTFITETYALLLEKQQKYSQASKIYNKLSLLFPEKRHYFAQKIELLKNL